MEPKLYSVEFDATISDEDVGKLFRFFEDGIETRRDWELLQLSKHIQQFKGEFNDADSLKLLATNLEVQSKLVRDQIETM